MKSKGRSAWPMWTVTELNEAGQVKAWCLSLKTCCGAVHFSSYTHLHSIFHKFISGFVCLFFAWQNWKEIILTREYKRNCATCGLIASYFIFLWSSPKNNRVDCYDKSFVVIFRATWVFGNAQGFFYSSFLYFWSCFLVRSCSGIWTTVGLNFSQDTPVELKVISSGVFARKNSYVWRQKCELLVDFHAADSSVENEAGGGEREEVIHENMEITAEDPDAGLLLQTRAWLINNTLIRVKIM